ncbi:MAG: toll/interleukin-1 receptor domain-containing protein [Deltaproteobacteria bacterium]|nr:toll/interleukin-1 receptor domain-containing protein [Deltaproteobacteria bacterium]
MRYKVFISYSKGLNFDAYMLQGALELAGSDVFLDMLAIDHGQDFEQRILENLKNCDELWVLLTPTLQSTELNEPIYGSTHRPYIWLETGVAWSRGIPIIPVLKHMSKSNLASNEDIPVLIKMRKAVELGNIHEYEELLASVKSRASNKQKWERISDRISVKLPLEVICGDDDICRTAILTELSKDGSGCFVSAEIPTEVQTINCSFDVDIIHRCQRECGGVNVSGVGGKLQCRNEMHIL